VGRHDAGAGQEAERGDPRGAGQLGQPPPSDERGGAADGSKGQSEQENADQVVGKARFNPHLARV
jgi:hypothetical protein